MPYTKTTWVGGATPPISAANLNHLETQYDEAVAGQSMFLLATETLSSDAVAVTIDGFSARAYKYLTLEMMVSVVSTGQHLLGTFFNQDDGSTNYSGQSLTADGSSVSASAGVSFGMGSVVAGFSQVVHTFSAPNGQRARFWSEINTGVQTSTNPVLTQSDELSIGAGYWHNTADITRLDIEELIGNSLRTGSVFHLWGVQ